MDKSLGMEFCEPLCGDRDSYWNGRKCVTCHPDQSWNADTKHCVKGEAPPKGETHAAVCDENSTVPQGGACTCRYPGMTQSSPTQCMCADGKTPVEGQGCSLHCDPPFVFNKNKTNCVCPHGYARKDSTCIEQKSGSSDFLDNVHIGVGVDVGGSSGGKGHSDKGSSPKCDPNGPLPCH